MLDLIEQEDKGGERPPYEEPIVNDHREGGGGVFILLVIWL